MEAGRMAGFVDPEGAVFFVWEANQHRGARIVNEHGALNFNNIADSRRGRFPAMVTTWERDNPGLRKGMEEMGVTSEFADVVATISPITEGQSDFPARWSVTFAVDNADASAQKAAELGGKVLAGPFDAPWVRMAVIADPQGRPSSPASSWPRTETSRPRKRPARLESLPSRLTTSGPPRKKLLPSAKARSLAGEVCGEHVGRSTERVCS
jgi:uncharacterized protein